MQSCFDLCGEQSSDECLVEPASESAPVHIDETSCTDSGCDSVDSIVVPHVVPTTGDHDATNSIIIEAIEDTDGAELNSDSETGPESEEVESVAGEPIIRPEFIGETATKRPHFLKRLQTWLTNSFSSYV